MDSPGAQCRSTFQEKLGLLITVGLSPLDYS